MLIIFTLVSHGLTINKRSNMGSTLLTHQDCYLFILFLVILRLHIDYLSYLNVILLLFLFVHKTKGMFRYVTIQDLKHPPPATKKKKG